MLTTHELNGVAAHLPRLVCVNRTLVADGPPRRRVHAVGRCCGTSAPRWSSSRHGEMLLVAEAPHRLDHTHHLHDDGHAHPVAAGRAA